MTKKIIQDLKAEQIAKLDKKIPDFKAGDTVRVLCKIVEEKNTRTQAYEGVCIARHNDGAASTFTVRKISNGVGVEKTWPLHSPNIEKVEVVRQGKVRRARLNYLRSRVGKAAKVKEVVR